MEVVIIENTELFVWNMPILMQVQERKDVFDVIEWNFDPQELYTLREFIESQWQLMVVVEEPESREDIGEPLLNLDAY